MPKKAGTKPLSQKEIAKMAELHRAGNSIAAIAKVTKRCASSVVKALRSRVGHPHPNRNIIAPAPTTQPSNGKTAKQQWIQQGLDSGYIKVELGSDNSLSMTAII